MTAYEQSMAELVRRVEALEKAIKDHQHDFTCELRTPLANADSVRQDRWHATYNAALMSALGSFDGWSVETLHEHSVECADRAHGPLEASARVEAAVLGAAAAADKVGALVKAADNAKRCRSESPGVCRLCAIELADALKPFEEQKL